MPPIVLKAVPIDVNFKYTLGTSSLLPPIFVRLTRVL